MYVYVYIDAKKIIIYNIWWKQNDETWINCYNCKQ